MNLKKKQKNIPLIDRLHVLFEDEYILVVEKASGILSQPIANSRDQSVIELMRLYWKSQNVSQRYLGIVHRIDKETSGLMVLAKNKVAHRGLHIQFSNHKVTKRYIALVDGIPRQRRGRLSGFVSRDKTGRRTVTKEPKGKEAYTRYKILETFRDKSLLELAPETGRAHQIRLQLTHIGCPILGEHVYVKSKKRVGGFKRVALHASKLVFMHPKTAKRVEFESPVPPDIKEQIHLLRQTSQQESS